VNTDLDALVTALYVTIDDLLATHPEWRPERPAVGIAPQFSDAEVLTLAVIQALLGFTSEARFIRYADSHLSGLFPYLPQRPAYNKRLRAAGRTMQHIIDALARDCPSWHDDLWLVDSVRHEALLNRAVMKGHRRRLVAASRIEAEGSLISGMGVTVGSSPDNDGTDQHCQMVRVRLARRKGVREESVSESPSSQATSSNLVDLGWVATRTRMTLWSCRGTLRPVRVAGRETMVNACGVTVVMLQGHSWAPNPLNGSRVNVGTTVAVPAPAGSQPVGGKTHRQSMRSGWDGGPVVVRARESRAHGEGVQRVRSVNVDRGGRW
jgi:hypothetical protein